MKKRLFFTFILAILLIFIGITSAVTPDLSVEKITDIQQTLTIYDKDNQVCATINCGENRQSISIDKIPKHVINALLAAEDIRFYEHSGIDIKRIFGALLADIKSGGYKEGASTITQQLIKNSHLSNEKTIMRKISEAILALQLERQYEKDEILEMYFNFVYFGRGAYGIQTASQSYFGKNAEELSVSEGATLVGILKAPSRYAPHLNMENAVSRRNTVLSQMQKYGFITLEEYEAYSKEPITIIEKEEVYDYGYFTDYVLEEGASILNISVSDFMASGYRVYTTQDSFLQNSLQEIYGTGNNFPVSVDSSIQSASVIIDNSDGSISALVGGREHQGMRVFNRATAKRQPGSCIKPLLVYAPAFENNSITNATLLDDFRKNFNGYSPANFNDVYYGKVTVRNALALSLNVPAVELLEKNGIEYSKSVAKKLGIEFDESDKNLAIALGGMKYGTSPLMLCNAYSTLARGGSYIKNWCIKEIYDENGTLIYKQNTTSQNAIKDTTAFLITDILCDVSKQKKNALSTFKNKIACKTGTVGYNKLGYSDAWSTSYVKSHTVCVWMGYDKTDEAHYLPEEVTGSTYPSLIGAKIYERIFEKYGYQEFGKPENVSKIKIDSFALFKDNSINLASEFTGKNYVLEEFFDVNSLPTVESKYWKRPSIPKDIKIQYNELRQIEIYFTVADELVNYNVYKKNVQGQEILVAVLKGNLNEQVKFVDEEFLQGEEYYILPVHTIATENGRLLEGEKSKMLSLN